VDALPPKVKSGEGTRGPVLMQTFQAAEALHPLHHFNWKTTFVKRTRGTRKGQRAREKNKGTLGLKVEGTSRSG